MLLGDTETEDCPSGCGQRTRTCSDTCGWSEWSGCEGQNVVCSPDEVESESCGACGQTRERTCNNICQWGSWGECQSAGTVCTLVTLKISHVEPVKPKPELVPMSACGAIGEPAKRDHVRLEKPKLVNAACAVLKQEAVLVNVHGKIGDHAPGGVCSPW